LVLGHVLGMRGGLLYSPFQVPAPSTEELEFLRLNSLIRQPPVVFFLRVMPPSFPSWNFEVLGHWLALCEIGGVPFSCLLLHVCIFLLEIKRFPPDAPFLIFRRVAFIACHPPLRFFWLVGKVFRLCCFFFLFALFLHL